MVSKSDIRKVKSLSRKKFRDSEGLFVVEGRKMVAEAVDSGFVIERIFSVEEDGEETMERLSLQDTPSPVLAIVRQPRSVLGGEFNPADSGLYLFLDSIRDPGNLGTILRIADWFGIKGVVASMDTVDVFNPKVVQASMGAIFRVDFRYSALISAANAVKCLGGSVYGTFLDGTDIYSKELETGVHSPCAIVIGNESNGISPELESVVDDRLYIPPYPASGTGSESLNAAVATALAVSEFRRRIR